MDRITPGEETMIGALALEARGLHYGPVKEKLAGAYPHFAARFTGPEN